MRSNPVRDGGAKDVTDGADETRQEDIFPTQPFCSDEHPSGQRHDYFARERDAGAFDGHQYNYAGPPYMLINVANEIQDVLFQIIISLFYLSG